MKHAAFFLGSNSGSGFVSLFEQAMGESPTRSCWLVKGGPGCGKSTLMGTLADRLGAQEYIRCASDPQSLDGVLLPGDRLVLDATAPHTLDTPLPGACGGYILTPPPLDRAGLEAKLPQLRGLAARASFCYAGVYRMLGAALLIRRQLRAAAEPALDQTRLLRRGKGIAGRELPAGQGPGRLLLRFLDGCTPEGWVCLWDTVELLAPRVYDLRDDLGAGEPLLRQLRDLALGRGHTVIACPDPLEPDRLRHLILPELGLAFVTSDSRSQYPGKPWRRLRLEAGLAAPEHRALRHRLRELRRQAAELEQNAAGQLAVARSLHDEMEALYRPHLDTAALDALTDGLTDLLK